MDEVKKKWSQMLRVMLNKYREGNPDDDRSDLELLESLMEYFQENGLVKKTNNGKWCVPDIEGSIPIIQ